MSDNPNNQTIFSSAGRTLEEENEIELLSVGVDIGSSTSHIIFSKIMMERMGNRYIVTKREALFKSEVLLTPYLDDTTIDADILGNFITRQYKLAGLTPDQIDTGALILTGVAVRRTNARAIGELFAAQAGKFVAVSAGDALETMLVAYGSGAVALSHKHHARVMNVDIGGGTSKIAVCVNGEVADITALDVGARIICVDKNGRINRLEEAGRVHAAEAGLTLKTGDVISHANLIKVVDIMVTRLFQAMGVTPIEKETSDLLRLATLKNASRPDIVTFSGGVSEYIYGHETENYGDLGTLLAAEIKRRIASWGPVIEVPVEGIRATVIGASQYTIQVSGNTIFVEPHTILPLQNVPVISPNLPLDTEALSVEEIAASIQQTLTRMELHDANQPVAMCFKWKGSATYARLDAFCRGTIKGMASVLASGLPLVLVNDGDIGGLIGLHCHSYCRVANPVISVDGILLNEFDYIDIGALLEGSGAVPVVVKSLVFPTTAALGHTRTEKES